MGRSRPAKKRDRNGQPQLPGPRTAAPSAERRVLPMELQIGDRLADETGEWEIIGR